MADFTKVQEELYRQGSEACRNYSQLTQRTRTLALIATVAAVAAPLSRLVDATEINRLLLPAGVLLMLVALSLGLVDWHYQSAFQAIRNVLARIEFALGVVGPWRAHFTVRGSWRDFIASYLPFGLLFAIGLMVAATNVAGDGSLAVATWVWFALALEATAAVVGTMVSMRTHRSERKEWEAPTQGSAPAVARPSDVRDDPDPAAGSS